MAVPPSLQSAPRVYDHIGVVSFSASTPDYRVSTDRETIGCFSDSTGVDCSSHNIGGVFHITLDDGKTYLLAYPRNGSDTPIQDLLLDHNQPDKHFHYTIVPNSKRAIERGDVKTLLCTPGRDKKGKTTSKETCYSYLPS
jgi:hypothetical protein